MANTVVGTIKKYQQAIGIKKRNAYVQAWAAPCARDVAVVFWATWKDIEAKLPKDDGDFAEADTPAKRRAGKNKYNAIVREAVRKHSSDLQAVLEYYNYKTYLAGVVEQARKLGCLGWTLSQKKKSSKRLTTPEKPDLSEADSKVNISLNLPNFRAQEYAKKHAAEAVTQIDDTTRKEIARIIQNGVDTGMSYGDIAKEINAKFKQFAVPKPQKHIANRGVLVAVTELGKAYCQANYDVGDMLQNSGVKMMKIWSTMEDDRVSDGCRHNQDAGWIELDKPFPSGDMMPPRFPGCRCDFLQDVLDESLLGRSIDDYFDRPDEEPIVGSNPPSRLKVDGENLFEDPDVGGKLAKAYYGDQDNASSVIEFLVQSQGFDGLPSKIRESDLGEGVLYRGVSGSNSEEVLGYHDDLLNGAWYYSAKYGGAIYGQGMYTVDDSELADFYAGSDGMIEKMQIKKDAKVLRFKNKEARTTPDDMMKLYNDYPGFFKSLYESALNTKNTKAKGLKEFVESDCVNIFPYKTNVAAAMGYDAVSYEMGGAMAGVHQVVILNRTALEVVE